MMKSWQELLQRWIFPGLKVKRWFVLLALGVILAVWAVVIALVNVARGGLLPDDIGAGLTLSFWPLWARILLPLGLGIPLTLWASRQLVSNLVAPFRQSDESISSSLYRYHHMRQRGPHIVAIGGGSGLPSLLRGLTQHTGNITSIVTMADDGGSSGRLRRELGLLPPGDLRSNMAALAADESLMSQLLRYRFGERIGSVGEGEHELTGHNFGNLLLAALTGITGSFDEALLAAERVLAVRGRVLPSTLAEVILLADVALYEDEQVVRVTGESEIPKANGRIQRVYLEPADARAYPPAIKAIFQADVIVLGPGSLFTSILPNLLVPEIRAALAHARAPIIYVCNLVTQPGETDNYNVADHVAAIAEYLPSGRLTTILANNNLRPDPTNQRGEPFDIAAAKYNYVRPVPAPGVSLTMLDLVDRDHPDRHDSEKLAQAVMDVFNRGL